MSNHFIKITDKGGYFGRFCWCNSNSRGNEGLWGSVTMFPITIHGAWAGSIPLLRILVR
jgi:hypothetical protein